MKRMGPLGFGPPKSNVPSQNSHVLASYAAVAALWVVFPGETFAGDAGPRDFPATLVVEEPQVETEIVPAIAASRNGDNARQTDFGTELSIQLASPLAVVVHPVFSMLRPGGNGFQNLETTVKYQFVADPVHEIVFSLGLSNEWSSIGAQRVGADPFSTITPTLFAGKGGGDLPSGWEWARPLAATIQIGFDFPAQAASPGFDGPAGIGGAVNPLQPNPYQISLAGSFQYNLPYASEQVQSLNVPGSLAELVPLVEYSFQIPVANNGAHLATIGTINPGVLWCHGNVQMGLEALIPINRESGQHPGVRLQLAYSFDTPWIQHAESEKRHEQDR